MGQTCPQRAETKDPPGASPGGKPPPRGLLPGPAYWAMLGPYWVKVLPVAVANVMDWYEYSAYAFLSDHIATVFFHNSTTIAWLTFGLTGVMRPVGGLLFGLIADHFGRRNALVTSLYVMLASTMGIGLAPNVPYVGPTCIVLCSILSGLGTGGEMGTAVVMLSESAPKPLLAQSGPVMSLGSQCGFLAALSVTTGLTALLSPAQMLQWGWRVPFLLASLPGALTIWYAYGAHESEEFEGAPDAPRCCEGPALVCMAENLDTTVWDHWRSGLLACVSVSGAVCGFWVSTTYFKEWLVHTAGQSPLQALSMMLATYPVAMGSQFLIAALADTYGLAKVLMSMSAFGAVMALPIYAPLYYHPTSLASVWLSGVLLNGISMTVINNAYPFVCEFFPSQVRGAGFSLYYQLAEIPGGLSPFICSQYQATPLFPAYFLMVVYSISIAGLVTCLKLHEAHKADPDRMQIVHIRAAPY